MCGTFGEASAISFYPAKTLGALGDAGAILTNNEVLYKKMIAYRDHGRDPLTGDIKNWGVNSRLDNLQAVFLNFSYQIIKKQSQTKRHRKIVQ